MRTKTHCSRDQALYVRPWQRGSAAAASECSTCLMMHHMLCNVHDNCAVSCFVNSGSYMPAKQLSRRLQMLFCMLSNESCKWDQWDQSSMKAQLQ